MFASTDPESIVQEYLRDPQVSMKNKKDVTFNNSIRVFVHMFQSPTSQVPESQPLADNAHSTIGLGDTLITLLSVREKLAMAEQKLKTSREEAKIEIKR